MNGRATQTKPIEISRPVAVYPLLSSVVAKFALFAIANVLTGDPVVQRTFALSFCLLVCIDLLRFVLCVIHRNRFAPT